MTPLSSMSWKYVCHANMCMIHWLQNGAIKSTYALLYSPNMEKSTPKGKNLNRRELRKHQGKQKEEEGRNLPFWLYTSELSEKQFLQLKRKSHTSHMMKPQNLYMLTWNSWAQDTHLLVCWTTPVLTMKAFGLEAMFATYLLCNLGWDLPCLPRVKATKPDYRFCED